MTSEPERCGVCVIPNLAASIFEISVSQPKSDEQSGEVLGGLMETLNTVLLPDENLISGVFF